MVFKHSNVMKHSGDFLARENHFFKFKIQSELTLTVFVAFN